MKFPLPEFSLNKNLIFNLGLQLANLIIIQLGQNSQFSTNL